MVDEPRRRLQVAIDEQAHHATEAGELRRRRGVVGMGRKAGIEHTGNVAMLFEEARDAVAAVVVLPHPERQRLQTTNQQVRAVRVGHTAEETARLAERIGEPARPHQRPREQIVVAA
jgi:hypothetical protein